jgi:hypothetical protein
MSRDWISRAACALPENRDVFLVLGDLEPGRVRIEVKQAMTEARAVCAGCPVRVPCQDHVSASEVPVVGMWAGEHYGPRRRDR